jgi:hypothetical protein
VLPVVEQCRAGGRPAEQVLSASAAAVTPALRERDSAKAASLTGAVAEPLRLRGVPGAQRSKNKLMPKS